MVFNQADGIYTYAYEAERNPDCVVCNQHAKPFEVESLDVKLQQVLDILTDAGGKYQMRGPAVTTVSDVCPRGAYTLHHNIHYCITLLVCRSANVSHRFFSM